MSERTKIIAAWVTLCIVWGMTYPAIRVALPVFPPFLLAGLRNFTGGVILFALARHRRVPIPREPAAFGVIVLVGLLYIVGANGGVTWAEQEVSGALTALVCTATPLMIAVLSLSGVKTDQMNRRGWTGLIIGFLGLAVLLQPWSGAQASPLHLAVLVFATFSWAVGATVARRYMLKCDPLAATAIEMLAGGGVLLTISGLAENGLRQPPAFWPVAAIVFLIIFGSCIGFTSFSYLITKLPPSRVSTYSYVNPVVAVLIGTLLLSEPFTTVMAVGAVITMTGVFLANTGHSTVAAKPAAGA